MAFSGRKSMLLSDRWCASARKWAPMIESLMLCGIGLLAGCLLTLLFMSAIHRRAVRLTRQQLTNETPLTAKEIQAEKDQLRAQFAMSVRKLEISMEEMRAKALDRSVDKQHAEIGRLQVELDKKNATVLVLRAREEVRMRAVRTIIKLLLYLFVRSKRRRDVAPPPFTVPQHPDWAFEREPDAGELASTAAAIAAVNLKRRQAVSNRH
jgi:hypothetical protein